jgi:hypothetical protein
MQKIVLKFNSSSEVLLSLPCCWYEGAMLSSKVFGFKVQQKPNSNISGRVQA